MRKYVAIPLESRQGMALRPWLARSEVNGWCMRCDAFSKAWRRDTTTPPIGQIKLRFIFNAYVHCHDQYYEAFLRNLGYPQQE